MLIYENGQVIHLPALVSIRRVSRDPEEDKKLEEEYYRHNREIAQMLIDKGFDKFSINIFFHAGSENEKKWKVIEKKPD